ncbi:hypothetical protein ES288_A12G119900v1 [Gossypium darwinii]|uniref:Uncharacterized protein n=1 Tax=Gossypium darwinii TaxID=34276 RepID=A0A5D2E878_GOSDA|nr:hypothetical protein ES288_A12G119900v1 [Gossypium darwinii]
MASGADKKNSEKIVYFLAVICPFLLFHFFSCVLLQERPYRGATLVTWRLNVKNFYERLTFWCHSGLLQKLLAFSGC